MFGQSGDLVMRNGLIIPRRRQTCWHVTFVAVAVKAIIRTFSGIRLLASPILANSFQNVSPLLKR